MGARVSPGLAAWGKPPPAETRAVVPWPPFCRPADRHRLFLKKRDPAARASDNRG